MRKKELFKKCCCILIIVIITTIFLMVIHKKVEKTSNFQNEEIYNAEEQIQKPNDNVVKSEATNKEEQTQEKESLELEEQGKSQEHETEKNTASVPTEKQPQQSSSEGAESTKNIEQEESSVEETEESETNSTRDPLPEGVIPHEISKHIIRAATQEELNAHEEKFGHNLTYCEYCGRPNVAWGSYGYVTTGYGLYGTCARYWTAGDHECINCGEIFPANTCHNCF